ncbi:glycosyltransferase [Mesorhizobium sp. 10J20-29]
MNNSDYTKMRILFVGYELTQSRAPHQAMAAIWLAANGHRVTYFAVGSEACQNWTDRLQGLTYLAFPGPRRLAGLALIRALFLRLYEGNVDCLYVQGAQQSVLCAWVPLVFPNLRIIYHTQDFKPLITRSYSRAERFLARRSHMVICNEINRAKVMELVHELRCTPEVIRTALPANWPVPGRSIEVRKAVLSRLPERLHSDEAVLLATGGPYMPRRKSYELVQSLAHLERSYCLVFTGMLPGSPEAEACLKTAELAGVRSRIVLLPRLDYQQLLTVYAACEIGILLYCDTDLANFYQAPGRLTEYLRAGIPYVASNFPGLELTALKYGTGEVADPNDPADIARAIRTLRPIDNKTRLGVAKQMQRIACSPLAYELDANRVLGRLFASDPMYSQHPWWTELEQVSLQDIAARTFLSENAV